MTVPRLTVPPNQPREVSRAIDVIGNAARTEILRALSEGPRTTHELALSVGTSRVSAHRHLQVLEEAGLVRGDRPPGTRLGDATSWTLAPDAVREMAAKWVDYVTGPGSAED